MNIWLILLLISPLYQWIKNYCTLILINLIPRSFIFNSPCCLVALQRIGALLWATRQSWAFRWSQLASASCSSSNITACTTSARSGRMADAGTQPTIRKDIHQKTSCQWSTSRRPVIHQQYWCRRTRWTKPANLQPKLLFPALRTLQSISRYCRVSSTRCFVRDHKFSCKRFLITRVTENSK